MRKIMRNNTSKWAAYWYLYFVVESGMCMERTVTVCELSRDIFSNKGAKVCSVCDAALFPFNITNVM